MITVKVPIYININKKKVTLMGLNHYRNAHFRVLDKCKKEYLSLVDLDIEGEPILEGTIHAHFEIYLKRKGTDGGNVRAVIEKFVLDAIKSLGYIKDDHAGIIVSDSSEYHFDKEFPRAVITLTKKDGL